MIKHFYIFLISTFSTFSTFYQAELSSTRVGTEMTLVEEIGIRSSSSSESESSAQLLIGLLKEGGGTETTASPEAQGAALTSRGAGITATGLGAGAGDLANAAA